MKNALLLPISCAAALLLSGCLTARKELPESTDGLGEARCIFELATVDYSSYKDNAGCGGRFVRQYFHYWRTHYHRAIQPRHDELVEAGHGDWALGARATLDELITPRQFRESVRYLHWGLAEPDLTPAQREVFTQLTLQHDLAELTYFTLVFEDRAATDERYLEKARESRKRLGELKKVFPDPVGDALPPPSP